MEFDLQSFLHEMRDEQRADHAALSAKVDAITEVVRAHETRLTVVEGTRRTTRWIVGACAVSAIGAAVDFLARKWK